MAADPEESRLPDDAGLLAFLLENIPDRIYFKDRQSRFIRASHAMAKLFCEADPAALIGKSDSDFFTEEHAQPAFEDESQIMRTGEAMLGKVEKETLPDGRIGWVLTTKMPLRNRDGAIVGTCGISKDVSALKEMEEALRASNASLENANRALQLAHRQFIEMEKIESVARLAAGVAHEIRNPLNTLTMGLECLAEQIAPNQSAAEILQAMRDAVRRADAVICALIDSSDTGVLKMEESDVRQLIEQALDVVEKRAGEVDIVTRKEFAANLPEPKFDRVRMEEALIGVISNAVEAMNGKGILTIRAMIRELTADDIVRSPGSRSGKQLREGEKVVSIEVEDTGPGIPSEGLPDIFDPFFTTKETGIGAGLGLTVARKILELHGGAIQIANRAEGGVKAVLLLRV